VKNLHRLRYSRGGRARQGSGWCSVNKSIQAKHIACSGKLVIISVHCCLPTVGGRNKKLARSHSLPATGRSPTHFPVFFSLRSHSRMLIAAPVLPGRPSGLGRAQGFNEGS
jgi:hypothetical protein